MVDLQISGVHTSTIGSFPLEDSEENRRRCVEDLLDIGVDFPTYPQLIGMGKQFLDDLAKQDCGIIAENDRYRLAGTKIAEDVPPPGLEPLLWTLRYLKDRGLGTTVKATITGPFTLASYIETGKGTFPFNTAASDLEIVRQLAHILSATCEAFSARTSIVSIDEPVLEVMVGGRILFGYRDEDIIEIYNGLRRVCGASFVGTHVCGRISPRLAETLLRTDLDFLSHEFHDSPRNIEVYSPENLKESGKILSVGCLSSKKPRVESREEILEVMKRFREYGDDLIFTPDCGFKPLVVDGSREKGYEISTRKLRNMVEAAKKLQET